MYILLQDAAIHQFIINVNDDVNIKFAKFTLYWKIFTAIILLYILEIIAINNSN